MVNDNSKVRSLEEIFEISYKARTKSCKIVQAHGTFDLLHFGHVKHLIAAKKQGHVLIVSVTADRHVNKGPDRPVFTEMVRAEMLAALEMVDYVVINNSESAVPAIRTIRPDFYAKGGEYVDFGSDVTGNIALEHAAVAECGGQIIFTNEETFSSSNLINQYLDVDRPEVKAYLDPHRKNGTLSELKELIRRMSDMRVLLVGDTIIDEYNYVTPLGKSPKENIIATLATGEREVFSGGVIAAANHLSGFCGQVDVLTTIGSDGYDRMIHSALNKSVDLNAVVRHGKPTTVKSRFVDSSYFRKLFEVYRMDDMPLTDRQENECIECFKSMKDAADIVIVTDFGHGMMTRGLIHEVHHKVKFLAVNTQTNSANTGFNLATRYNPSYLCIDEPEARLAVGRKHEPLSEVSFQLTDVTDCRKVIITHGRHGCITNDRDKGEMCNIPAFTNSVVDTIGAGDAFLSLTAPLVALGASMEHVGIIGNIAGALKVGIVGHRQPVTKVALLKYMEALLK